MVAPEPVPYKVDIDQSILDHLQHALPDHPPNVKPRSLAQYKAMFVNLGMNIIDHKRFKLEQEDSWKDLIVVEFSKHYS